jgi:hypothetical protein
MLCRRPKVHTVDLSNRPLASLPVCSITILPCQEITTDEGAHAALRKSRPSLTPPHHRCTGDPIRPDPSRKEGGRWWRQHLPTGHRPTLYLSAAGGPSADATSCAAPGRMIGWRRVAPAPQLVSLAGKATSGELHSSSSTASGRPPNARTVAGRGGRARHVPKLTERSKANEEVTKCLFYRNNMPS